MKKIFAFVLATIMVLSLVPASAFAAITKCPAVHTTTNCEFDKVKTVPSTCETVGYTEYVCKTCGDSFVDNLTPKAEHTWKSNPEYAASDIAASCVYKTNGIQYLICTVCGEEYGEDGYKTIDYNSTSVHNLVYTSGVGCEKLYTCTLCGAEGYIDEEAGVLTEDVAHTWEFSEMETEPYWKGGKKYSGMAIFTCECGATKKVTVDTPACDHASHTDKNKATVVQAAKVPTCDAAGAYLVVKCPDCNAHWVCKTAGKESYANKTTPLPCIENHKDMNDHVWTVLDDSDDDGNFKEHASISKWGHVQTTIVDANKNGELDCGESYYCARCTTYQTQGHVKPASSEWTYYVFPNCTTKGQYVTQCVDCGQYIYGTDSKAAGHTKVTVTLPATCTSPALKFQYCSKENCPVQKTLINGQYYSLLNTPAEQGNINVDNHNWIINNQPTHIGNVNPDIYCTGMSYVYKMCANGCAKYGAGYTEIVQPVMHDLKPYKTAHNYMTVGLTVDGVVLPQWTTRQWVKCTKCNYAPAVAYTDVPDTTIKTSFDSVTEALEYHGLVMTYWKLNSKGELVVDTSKGINGYEGLGAYAGKTVAEIQALVFGTPIPGLSTPATCQTPATSVYICNDCNTYVWIKGQTNPHTLTNKKAGKPATCTTPGSYDTYKCNVCNVTYWLDAAGKAHTEAPTKLPCSDTVVYVPGACGDKNGYWQCTKCNTCYTDATCKEKYVPTLHKYVTLLEGVAATCNTTGLPEIRYCEDCAVLEINLIYSNGGKEVRVNFNETGIGYKKGAVSVDLTTTYLSAKVTVNVDAKGNVSFIYSNDNWVEWPSYVNVKKMETSSNHRGLYLKASGELATGVVGASTVEFKKSETQKEYSYTVLDHTKPYFHLVECEACVYEFVKDYVPAKGGHVNAKGQLIDVNSCNDDPICVICADYYNNDPSYASKYTFGAHNWQKSAESTATCVSAGYLAEYCDKCGEYKIDPDSFVTVDADKYHDDLLAKESLFPWIDDVKLVGTKEDYAHAGAYYWACAACGEALTDLVEEACPGTGVEFTLDTDDAVYGPGASIFVTVTIDSLKGVDVWGANFAVEYDYNAVEFVGSKIVNAAFTGTAYAPTEKVDMGNGLTQYVPTGLVNVALSSIAGEAIKGASELVVLEFKVAPANNMVKAAQFAIGEVHYGEVEELVIGSNGRKIASMYNDFANCEVAITTLADLDKDNATTMFDAFELYYLIVTDEYDVVADIDGDGQLTVDGDLALLYSYIVGETNIEDIIHPPVEKEKDRVYKYDENGLLIYDSYCDFNGNGVIDTVSEMAAFTGRIDPDQFWASQE